MRLGLLIALLLSACGASAQRGGCGPVLSPGECQIVRAQLGTLAPQPPPDPTNRAADSDDAAELGRRLFFDKCLSSDWRSTDPGATTACVSCHDPGVAFIDARRRAVAVSEGGQTLTRQRRVQASISAEGKAYTGRNSPTLYNVGYGAAVPALDGARVAGANWAPLDGRYDSLWALVAEVFEFGATQRSNRAHVALRIFRQQQHRELYEKAFGLMPRDMDDKSDGKYIYPRNASPATGFNADWVKCWNPNHMAGKCPDDTLPITDTVRANINRIFANSGKALEAYMRRLRSASSPYDQWLAGNPTAMSAAAQRGLRLFIGKAECILCHSGPNFTDWRFHNLGVPAGDPEKKTAGSDVELLMPDGASRPQPCYAPGTAAGPKCPDPGRWAWLNRLTNKCAPGVACQNSSGLSCAAVNLDKTPFSDDTRACLPQTSFDRCDYPDEAACRARPSCEWQEGMAGMTPVRRCAPRPDPRDLGAFKTPSLRNVARTWPYMHNGALHDYGPAERGEVAADDPTPHLMKVVEFYNRGGGTPPVGTLSPLIRPLHLTRAEMSDLVEFLKALTDESVKESELARIPPDLIDVTTDCPP